MAEVTLDVTQILPGGVAPDAEDSLSTANTYLVANDGRVFLHFKKDEATDAVITVVTPKTVGGLAVADREITVPASTGDLLCGPFPPNIYNSAGYLSFSADNIAGLSVACYRL